MSPNRAVPVRRPPPPQTASEGVDSTLALLAAIKENRAGMLRSEETAKSTASQPAQLEPPVKVQPSKSPERAPVPTMAVAPAPLTVVERIERHPAMPLSRNIPVTAGSRGNLLREAAPIVTGESRITAAIAKIPGGRITLLVVGGLIAVGGITTGLMLRGHRATAPRVVTAAAPVAASAANNFPLQLQIEPQGKQINVHWNPQSTLITQSRDGRLVITENNQKPRTIALSLDQLRFGHLTYQPLTERVEFRLEVVGVSGAVAEESILSLANPPAPSLAPVPATGLAAGLQPATAAQGKVDPSAGPATPENTKASRAAARAFAPPSVNRTPAPGALVDAPPDVNTNGIAPLSLPTAQVPRAGAPPPAIPAPATTLQVESNLQAAKLLNRVTPAYPALAKSARVQGTVHFKATIGKDGTVRNLEVVGGPGILRQAAMDAVKQWKYQPTLLNGQPTEVVTAIDVNFSLGQ